MFSINSLKNTFENVLNDFENKKIDIDEEGNFTAKVTKSLVSLQQVERLRLLLYKVLQSQENEGEEKAVCIKQMKRYLFLLNRQSEISEFRILKINKIESLVLKSKDNDIVDLKNESIQSSVLPPEYNNIVDLKNNLKTCLEQASTPKIKKILSAVIKAYGEILSQYQISIECGMVDIDLIEPSHFVEKIVDEIHNSSAYTLKVPDTALENLVNTEYKNRSKLFNKISKSDYEKIIKSYKSKPWIGIEEFNGYTISYSQTQLAKLYLNHYFNSENFLIEELDKHGKASKWISKIRNESSWMKTGAFETLTLPWLKKFVPKTTIYTDFLEKFEHLDFDEE